VIYTFYISPIFLFSSEVKELRDIYLSTISIYLFILVDRELRMIERKRELNELYERLGEELPYDLSFADDKIVGES
jgi:hypothetical protein